MSIDSSRGSRVNRRFASIARQQVDIISFLETDRPAEDQLRTRMRVGAKRLERRRNDRPVFQPLLLSARCRGAVHRNLEGRKSWFGRRLGRVDEGEMDGRRQVGQSFRRLSTAGGAERFRLRQYLLILGGRASAAADALPTTSQKGNTFPTKWRQSGSGLLMAAG